MAFSAVSDGLVLLKLFILYRGNDKELSKVGMDGVVQDKMKMGPLPSSLSPHVCLLPCQDLVHLLQGASLPPLHEILQSFSPLPQGIGPPAILPATLTLHPQSPHARPLSPPYRTLPLP